MRRETTSCTKATARRFGRFQLAFSSKVGTRQTHKKGLAVISEAFPDTCKNHAPVLLPRLSRWKLTGSTLGDGGGGGSYRARSQVEYFNH